MHPTAPREPQRVPGYEWFPFAAREYLWRLFNICWHWAGEGECFLPLKRHAWPPAHTRPLLYASSDDSALLLPEKAVTGALQKQQLLQNLPTWVLLSRAARSVAGGSWQCSVWPGVPQGPWVRPGVLHSFWEHGAFQSKPVWVGVSVSTSASAWDVLPHHRALL